MIGAIPNWAAAVTPLTHAGKLDELALTVYLRYLGARKLGVCLAPYLNGEGLLLEEAEIRRIYELGVLELKGKVPVVAAALGYTSTARVIRSALEAAGIGVDAVQIYPPRPGPNSAAIPNQEMFETYYREVCESVHSPLVLGLQTENCPGQQFPIEIIRRLLDDYPNIVAINCSAKNEGQLIQMVKAFEDRVPVRCTSMRLLWAGLRAGVAGILSPEANVCPDWMNDAVDLFKSGNGETCLEIIDRIRSLELWWDKYPVAAQKTALHHLGLMSAAVRRPYLPLSDQLAEELKRQLETMGLLKGDRIIT